MQPPENVCLRPLFTLPDRWGLSSSGGAPVHLYDSLLSITHPTLASPPLSPASSCSPQHNYSPHDKRQALSAEISKSPGHFLNEGTLAAPCSLCLSAGEQCPWPSCTPPSSPRSFLLLLLLHHPRLSVPSSGGLVRGATWRASPAWFISLAPLPGHSGRPKEPTRLQRASARKPGISWNKPFCRPVKNVLWLAN